MPSSRWVVERSCKQKRCYTAADARKRVTQERGFGNKLSMYRCPFANEHADPAKRWHIGHAPSQRSLQAIANVIRERQGYKLDRRR